MCKLRKVWISVTVVLIILLCIVGDFFFRVNHFNKKYFNHTRDNKTEEVEVLSTTNQENIPKADIGIEDVNCGSNITEMEVELKHELGQELCNWGICYYNLDTKEYLGINDDEKFMAASTVKVPIAMVISDMLFNGEIDESYKIYYRDINYEDGCGIMKGMDLTKPYDIMSLMEYMIVYSDNIATNMIFSGLGYREVKNRFSNYLGYDLATYENVITPKEACTYLKKLYYNDKNNPYYDRVIEFMKNTEFHDRIDRNLDDCIVAHKIGDYEEYSSDIGIVYTVNSYILVIYTKEVSDPHDKISEISDIIYKYSIE